MIKIVSEESDKTTNSIIEWILFYGKTVKRINYESFSDFSILLTNENSFSEFNNIFHRRAKINAIPNNSDLDKYMTFFKEEEDTCIKAFEKIHKDSHSYIGGYNEEQQHNKILDLYIARKVGMSIPNTIVTNKKEDLLAFYHTCNKRVITKPIKNSLNIQYESHLEYGKPTFMITDNDLEILETNFNLGLFQEYTEKKFEIRVFVFDHKIYSMAIFSQSNEKTKVDYRNYDEIRPNRCVPYKLPEIIKKKIFQFMKNKQIDTGSIDIIFSEKNEYVFLENNPQGQFDWLSKNCNYYVEKEIAETLILKNEK